ncbi:MAG: DMT family transporter, partial [Phycisphaerae bacterium]|nr:DMT family transporter [Phycisphaerae bacterium]
MRYPQQHFLALVLSLLLWGFSFPALKVALRTNGPVTVLFYRYALVFLLVLPYFLWRHRKEASVLIRNKGLLILGLSNGAGSLLQFAGLDLTSSIKSALLTQTTVVAVPILAIWVLGERLNGSKVIAIGLSLAGAVMLSTNLDLRAMGEGSSLAGDGLTLAAVVFWAIFIIYTRRLTQRLPVFWLLWANTLVTFLFSGCAALAAGQLEIDRTGLAVCLFLAVFCTIGPQVLYNYALKEVDATTSAILGPLETVS